MGGILLIFSLIAIYLVVYWSIYIELIRDKTKGFLGFISSSDDTLNVDTSKKKSFVRQKKSVARNPLENPKSIKKSRDTEPKIKKHTDVPVFRKQKTPTVSKTNMQPNDPLKSKEIQISKRTFLKK
jgi:hypothetical protein